MVLLGWPWLKRLVTYIKTIWNFICKIPAFLGWYRENIRTFGQEILFLRVALWTVALIPYYYKHNSIPVFLAKITPKKTPWRRLDPELEKEMQLISAYIVGILNQYPSQRYRMCFRRSLVQYRFLRAYGVSAQWLLGVRKINEGEEKNSPGVAQILKDHYGGMLRPNAFIGHAWIEIDGKHYHDEMEAYYRYSVTFTYPSKEQLAREVVGAEQEVDLDKLGLPRLTDLGGDGDAWFE
jgi:hypothetical protein